MGEWCIVLPDEESELTGMGRGTGPRTLCNACGLVYAKLVRCSPGSACGVAADVVLLGRYSLSLAPCACLTDQEAHKGWDWGAWARRRG